MLSNLLNKKDIPIYWAVFFSFSILNLPSIKIFYSSELVNIIAITGLWLTIVYRHFILKEKQIEFCGQKKLFFILFSTLWFLFFVYMFIGPNSGFKTTTFLQFGSVYAAVIGVLWTSYKEIKYILYAQVFWSFIISFSYMFLGLSYDRALGQHYLTLGVPIAAGLVILASIIINNPSKRNILLFGPLVVFLIIGLSSLLGRSPLLFSVGVIFIFWFLRIMSEGTLDKIIKKILYMIVVLVVGVVIFLNFVSFGWLKRFKELFNGSSNSRMETYKNTLNLIMENPFGYGTNAHYELLGRYPHNIFLETTLSVGVIGGVILVAIVYIYLKTMWSSLRNVSHVTSISLAALYFFLTWNVSFNLQSSYIVFGAIALTLSTAEDFKSSFSNHEKR